MVHVCVYGASMHKYVFGGVCMCIWCMYVYMVHLCTHVCLVVHVCIYGAYICIVIGGACGAHAFQVLFTFQVLFM